MKRPGSAHDTRQEPQTETPAESAANFRVDRVFVPRARTAPPTPSSIGATPAVPTAHRPPQPPRTRRVSTGPEIGTDTERSPFVAQPLALARRQLAEAQRELASAKDEEIAGEVEKRHEAGAAHDAQDRAPAPSPAPRRAARLSRTHDPGSRSGCRRPSRVRTSWLTSSSSNAVNAPPRTAVRRSSARNSRTPAHARRPSDRSSTTHAPRR